VVGADHSRACMLSIRDHRPECCDSARRGARDGCRGRQCRGGEWVDRGGHGRACVLFGWVASPELELQLREQQQQHSFCFCVVEKLKTSKSVPNKDIRPRGGGTLQYTLTLTRLASHGYFTDTMSFQDIESGQGQPLSSPSQTPQSREEAAFLNLQSSLSLRVFKINANVQGIFKLVDQLGSPRDSSALRKSLCVSSLIN
jgi:hypothetical protein